MRLARIVGVARRYGLFALAAQHVRMPWLRLLLRGVVPLLTAPGAQRAPRGQRLRCAFEELGPLFVKFGQVLSTRRDLLPVDVADELAKLQDQVPPFASAQARQVVEAGLGRPIETMFSEFDDVPVASASIAQVHFAVVRSGPQQGRRVAVKVLRPGMQGVIEKDLSLMRTVAGLVDKLSADGKRLKPREVVAEFDKHLHDELDLMREAANASQLRRNFGPKSGTGHLLRVPEMLWDYCSTTVITMERMQGIPISHIERLQARGIDLKKLSREGVEIFFTQVFRDGFFHADMHPGNIYVGDEGEDFGRYIALDFGIVGTLNDVDKHYLAQNFLAFFRQNYKRVAQLHIESGWVPKSTREDELEAAIRACIEPFFDKPLKDISLGKALLSLFQTSRRFNVEIQPQLVLLQKTLLNVEGLGRQLNPDLDLWKTAKPFLENWMQKQIGWRGFKAAVQWEAAQWTHIVPALPRLVHQALTHNNGRLDTQMELLIKQQKRLNKVVLGLVLLVLGLGAVVLLEWALVAWPGLWPRVQGFFL